MKNLQRSLLNTILKPICKTQKNTETINNAVADVNRCIEISTVQKEITEEDKDNKQCPEMIKGETE